MAECLRILDKTFASERAKETSCIVVTAKNVRVNDYKIYVNGNIRKTSRDDREPNNGHLIRVKPGNYRIVIRELEVFKKNRLESNTIYFDISEAQTIVFIFELIDNKLILKY